MKPYLPILCLLFLGADVFAQSQWLRVDLPKEIDYTTDMSFSTASHGFLATPNGLWMTVDSGKTWKRTVMSAHGVYALDSLHIYSVSKGGIFGRSTDAGRTWKQTLLDPPCTYCFFDRVFFLDTLFGYTAGGYWDWTGEGVRARTTDGGVTWEYFTENRQGRVTEIYFANSKYGLMGTSHGLYFSEDSGWAWSHVGAETNSHHLGDSLFLTKSGHSTNWGKTWQYPFLPGEFLDGVDEIVYAVSGGRSVYKSVDSGWTWIEQTTLPYDTNTPLDINGIEQIEVPDRNVAYVRAFLRFYRATGGGGDFVLGVDNKSESVPSLRRSISRSEPIMLTSVTSGYEIYDVLGSRIRSSSIHTDRVETSDLSPGLYLLRVDDGTERVLIY